MKTRKINILLFIFSSLTEIHLIVGDDEEKIRKSLLSAFSMVKVYSLYTCNKDTYLGIYKKVFFHLFFFSFQIRYVMAAWIPGYDII